MHTSRRSTSASPASGLILTIPLSKPSAHPRVLPLALARETSHPALPPCATLHGNKQTTLRDEK
jgi:hypothetical protein